MKAACGGLVESWSILWVLYNSFHMVPVQVFVGRTAQLGFLAAVIGEKVTGKGILQQIGIETGARVSAPGRAMLRPDLTRVQPSLCLP